MALISTKDLMDDYFGSLDPIRTMKTRKMIDRQELYDYEEKIGKVFIDMNDAEIIDMMSTFNNIRESVNGKVTKLSSSSITAIISGYRNIFNFYTEKYDPSFRNPLYSKAVKEFAFSVRNSSPNEKITDDVIDNAISALECKLDGYDGKAKYIECIILMFLNGFVSTEEMICLKEEMISFRTNEVNLDRCVLKLSDRCMEAMMAVHEMRTLESKRHVLFKTMPYQGSYLRLITRNTSIKQEEFDEKDIKELARQMHWYLKDGLNGTAYSYLNYQKIYYFGFYKYIVSRCGESHAKEIITSMRSKRYTDELVGYTLEYGLTDSNVTRIKEKLTAYI